VRNFRPSYYSWWWRCWGRASEAGRRREEVRSAELDAPHRRCCGAGALCPLPRRESMYFPAADGTSRTPAKLQILGKELLCSGEVAQTSWTPTSNRSFSRADPEELILYSGRRRCLYAGRGAAGARTKMRMVSGPGCDACWRAQ
jgi:hypothetical protein